MTPEIRAAYLEIAALLGISADDPSSVVFVLRERLREADRIAARKAVLESRRERAVDVLEGRAS